MKQKLKTIIISSACKSMYGMSEEKLPIPLTDEEKDSIYNNFIEGLKEGGYEVKRIVKFKEGDIIGTYCGNYVDCVIMSVKDDILELSIYFECGHRQLFDTCTYDSLIDRGFRVKEKKG